MIYRRTPARAPKLLLAITYGVGSGAVLGAAACASVAAPAERNPCGSLTLEADCSAPAVLGLVGGDSSLLVVGMEAEANMEADATSDANLDDADGGVAADADAQAASASDANYMDEGVDAGADGAIPCGAGFCGTMVIPKDASDDATSDH